MRSLIEGPPTTQSTHCRCTRSLVHSRGFSLQPACGSCSHYIHVYTRHTVSFYRRHHHIIQLIQRRHSRHLQRSRLCSQYLRIIVNVNSSIHQVRRLRHSLLLHLCRNKVQHDFVVLPLQLRSTRHFWTRRMTYRVLVVDLEWPTRRPVHGMLLVVTGGITLAFLPR